MTSSFYRRPVRRPIAEPVFENQAMPAFHAPYLHENCTYCDQALLEAIGEGRWDEAVLLPTLAEAYFDERDLDPFRLYRHFHPQYLFNHSPFEPLFVPVAIPGKGLSTELQVGDLVLMRNILSNRTYQAVITDPVLRPSESFGSQDSRKSGAFVQVYGNFWGDTNSAGFIRVLDEAGHTPRNILILRKGRPSESAEEEALSEAPAVQDHKLRYQKYGRNEGYQYGGDRSINYSQIFADNQLSDFEAKTAQHFIETEGGIDSINTYDDQLITWGFGFAGKSGNFTIALHLLLSSNAQARADFQSYGITLSSEKKADLTVTTDGGTYTGDAALEFWKFSKRYLNILIQLTQQYAKEAFRAQWQTFKQIHAAVFKAFADPAFLANITNETERNKAKVAVLHAHHHFPGYNPPGSFKEASSFEEVLSIYVKQSSKRRSVQGHADNWRTSINKIFSGNAAPLPPPPGPRPSDPPSAGLLRGSVGKGGQNNTDDTLKVQALLNGAGISIPVNGQIVDNEGDLTILAIFRYQGKKKLKGYDGRIDPNGATIKALVAEAKLPVITGSESEAAEVYEDSGPVQESTSDPANALDFQWMNLKPARHPRGYERLYYVTSGAKGTYGSCYFPFSIRNDIERNFWDYSALPGLMMNVYAQVQLTRTSDKKQVTWKQTTKAGETSTIWKKLALATTMGMGQKLQFGKGVEVSQEMLQRARDVDNDDLSARMDIEIYFTEQKGYSRQEYVKKNSLLFYLVRPIEYVFGRQLSVRPDKKKEKALVMSLRRRLLAVPAHLQTKVTVTISKTDTTSENQSFNIQASVERTSTKGVTLSVPFSKLLDGLGLEASFSSEVKRSMAYSYTMEKSFGSEAAESFTTEIELPPAKNRFKYRQIFIEPRLIAVPLDKVYHFTDVNEFGAAQRIEALDIPFIYKIDGWNINTDEFTND